MAAIATAAPSSIVNISPGVSVQRLQLCGTATWQCRYCGKVNSHRMRYSTWKVRCKEPSCKRWVMFVLVMTDVPVGIHSAHAWRESFRPAYVSVQAALADIAALAP